MGEGLGDSVDTHTHTQSKWQISVLDSVLVSLVTLWGEVRASGLNTLQVSVEELSRVLKQQAFALLTAFKVRKCK